MTQDERYAAAVLAVGLLMAHIEELVEAGDVTEEEEAEVEASIRWIEAEYDVTILTAGPPTSTMVH